MEVRRLENNPIITPASSPSIGDNINGPSLIRVPDWVRDPLGRYYLYFSHHKGKHIRLAHADAVEGPWKIHEPGALSLADSLFPTEISVADFSPSLLQRFEASGVDPLEYAYPHIASPDVLVNDEAREICLYYHGMLGNGAQMSRVAVSNDGLTFSARPEIIARSYLRMFIWQDAYYGIAMPGVFYRSADGVNGFEEGPSLFNPDMRHAAVMVRGDELHVFWTQVGDSPERILLSTVNLTPDWCDWQASEPVEVMRPERAWEGADLPLAPSVRGAIEVPANQLRDPGLFEEVGRTWLLYAVAGESGIAIAELTTP